MPSLVTTLEFHEPCLTDASWMVPILRAADNKACEYSFTTIFMWRKYYENQVAHCGEHLFLKSGHGPASTYMMPVGGDLLSAGVAEVCRAAGVPYYPGCVTPTEIMAALELGITTVKFFPANVYGGLASIRALSAPFPQVKFLPTGGVDLSNLAEYLACDRVAAVGGSFMMKGDIRGNCRRIREVIG